MPSVIFIQGLLEEDEIPFFEKMAERTQKVYWLPLVWAGTMTATARKEGRVENDVAMKTILDEIVKLRLLCAKCSSMVTVNVPLSYSQVCSHIVAAIDCKCEDSFLVYPSCVNVSHSQVASQQ
jgi:hypothetical protein